MIQYIPIGRKHAISRTDLAFISGLSDRKMRDKIAELQDEGYAVANTLDGQGYFIANSKEEFEPYLKVEMAREKTQINKVKKLKEIFK